MNPYEPSKVPRDEAVLELQAPERPQRTYRIQMAWADRYRFLRAVGPLRIYAIAGGVMAAWALYGLLQTSYEMWRLNDLQRTDIAIFGIRILFAVARGLLALSMCWLYWKFADTLAATAGGTSASMGVWSRLQLRMAHLLVATMAVGLASQGWEWLLDWYVLDLLAGADPL